MSTHRISVVEVTAGDVEAWTSGDADPLDSEFGKAIHAALKMIQAGQQRRTEILLSIMADE